MDIKKIVDKYVETGEFELKIINGKAKVYYYDKIGHFSSKKITIIGSDKKVDVEGNNLVIETLFKELLVISGNIEKITLGKVNE